MLEVRDVAVRLGGHLVLDGVDLDVGASDVVALLGASGSGKSTLLRVVAGLLPADRGAVSWDGENLAGVPAPRRHIGMLFQDHVLFPHRDVAGNVELGLRMRGRDKRERRARVAEMLELVGLAGYEQRRVATLSGGEQQRVALARALAPSPRLLLLDEPFGALDRPLRDRLVADVAEIVRSAEVPAIVVTHDRDEAFALADHVGVLAGGRIVQCAPPTELWHDPVDEHVASLIGLGQAFDATVDGDALITPWGRLQPFSVQAGSLVTRVCTENGAAAVRALFRPDALTIDERGVLDAVVRRIAPHGGRSMVEVALDGHTTVWAAPGDGPAAVSAGDAVRLRVDPYGVVVFAQSVPDAGTSSPSPAPSAAGVANDQ